MIKEIIKQWDERKHVLEEYFKTTKQEEYDEYETIVKKILELVITDAPEYYGEWDKTWNVEAMTVINDGDYQGTLIFIIPTNTYQPSIENYLMTHNYYGSCSGCDTLQSIGSYDDDLPNEQQVKEYMTLALHLVQKMKILGKGED